MNITEDFEIIEVTNVIKGGIINKIKTWEDFVELAKNNNIKKVYKYGKIHFMTLPTGIAQIKKKN